MEARFHEPLVETKPVGVEPTVREPLIETQPLESQVDVVFDEPMVETKPVGVEPTVGEPSLETKPLESQVDAAFDEPMVETKPREDHVDEDVMKLYGSEEGGGLDSVFSRNVQACLKSSGCM